MHVADAQQHPSVFGWATHAVPVCSRYKLKEDPQHITLAAMQSSSHRVRNPAASGALAAAIVGLAACLLLQQAMLQRQALHSLLAVSNKDLPAGQTADVAIVLGYALFRSGEPTEPLKGRVAAGVQAFLEGKVARVVFSGAHPTAPGGGKRQVSEANVMLQHATRMLEANGTVFRTQDWILEEASTSTRENALQSLTFVAEHKWLSVLLVTCPFHQRRALWVFRKAAADLALEPPPNFYVWQTPFVGHRGYKVLGEGHPAIDAVVDVWDWVREVLAIGYYWAKGFV